MSYLKISSIGIEEYRDIPDYEGLYQCSDYGNIKSVAKRIKWKNTFRNCKEAILTKRLKSSGYLQVVLYKNKVPKDFAVHQLVAMCFHNHTPCGYKLVVNHKDLDKLNNKASNLEIVTARENSNRKHLPSSSIYTGVCWNNRDKKWAASIVINKKKVNLGYYDDEIEAAEAYNNKLKELI